MFFDALDLAWEHEPEGYVVDRTGYLPDFWLKYSFGRQEEGEEEKFHGGMFWEVKPTPDGYDDSRVRGLVMMTKADCCVSFGPPADFKVSQYFYAEDRPHWMTDEEWNESPHVRHVSWTYNLTAALLGDIIKHDPSRHYRDRLNTAAAAASAYRFWDPK